jgi:hypothetical protein
MSQMRWSDLMKSLDVLRPLDAQATAVVEGWIYGALDDVATLTQDIASLREEMTSLALTIVQVQAACTDISDLRAVLHRRTYLEPTMRLLDLRTDAEKLRD